MECQQSGTVAVRDAGGHRKKMQLLKRAFRRRWEPVRDFLGYRLYRLFLRNRSFEFAGVRLPYFYHPYRRTWFNERCVEIPIVRHLMREVGGTEILEVGNVLSHYFPVSWDVVDKYEVAPGVINADIVDYAPAKSYDLIISISTLEHIGWDEEPRQPKKIYRAVDKLFSLLASGGRIIITLPLGYNREVDQALEAGRFPFSRQFFLKRINRLNDWREASWEEVRGSRYWFPFPNANAIVVGIGP